MRRRINADIDQYYGGSDPPAWFWNSFLHRPVAARARSWSFRFGDRNAALVFGQRARELVAQLIGHRHVGIGTLAVHLIELGHHLDVVLTEGLGRAPRSLRVTR